MKRDLVMVHICDCVRAEFDRALEDLDLVIG